MNLRKLILVNNDCYKANRIIAVKGIMVHSTGANNPWLKRYVGPDDGMLGINQYGNHWNTARPGGRQVCVHAFIGKLKDGTIATYQTLPWNMRGWHGGGSSNNTHIGLEICEDGLTDPAYFSAVYKEAVELCVFLCKQYGLTEKNIICHSEGCKLGIASNHRDVMHWFPKHGKSMDAFRAAVATLGSKTAPKTTAEIPAATPALAHKKGDTVDFRGSKHYADSNSGSASNCKPGRATVTGVSKNGKHPYHLVGAQGGSTVYGWVDAADVARSFEPAKAIKVGSKVKVRPGAKTYAGGQIAPFVYRSVYCVRQLSGDRVVIAPAMTGAITAAVKVSDLVPQ